MGTKHTPGPWSRVYDFGELRIEAWHDGTDGVYHVCTLPDAADESDWRGHDCAKSLEADARLIAAAPELLEACIAARELLGIAARYFPKSVKDSDKFSLLNTLNNCIDPAIAKAAGQEAATDA